jgi:hypothetical protein
MWSLPRYVWIEVGAWLGVTRISHFQDILWTLLLDGSADENSRARPTNGSGSLIYSAESVTSNLLTSRIVSKSCQPFWIQAPFEATFLSFSPSYISLDNQIHGTSNVSDVFKKNDDHRLTSKNSALRRKWQKADVVLSASIFRGIIHETITELAFRYHNILTLRWMFLKKSKF